MAAALPTEPRPIPETRALWVKVSLLTVGELHQVIEETVQAGRTELILNVNAHCMNLAYELPWLRKLLNEARVVFCDGAGVALALRRLSGVRVPERITYADWMWKLAAFCAERRYRLYFVGAAPGVAGIAAERLRARFPDLVIAGCEHGYFQLDGRENDELIERINNARPNVLVLGLGMPLQERWLGDNRGRIAANVLLSGGAVFDYVAGSVRRGPRLLVDHGFEWLARLLIEPRRLWKRYLLGNPRFLLRAWRHTRSAGGPR